MKLVIYGRIIESKSNRFRNCYATIPIEYKSKNKFVKDFKRASKNAYEPHCYGRGCYFKFLGITFEAFDYYFIFSNGNVYSHTPEVFELEEWFKKYNGV